MSLIDRLVSLLGDGKANALHAGQIEDSLNIGIGNTQEPTRDLIREAIVNHNMPIGSTPQAGYFLIDTQTELDEAIQNLEQRIRGIQRRIDGLHSGWQQRRNDRARGGNWPK